MVYRMAATFIDVGGACMDQLFYVDGITDVPRASCRSYNYHLKAAQEQAGLFTLQWSTKYFRCK